MEIRDWSAIVLFAASVAMAQSAYGQQPPDSVTSDGFGNTAMGSNALLDLSTAGDTGENTAAGYYSLSANISGSQNSAFGSWTLYFNTTGYGNTASGDHALYSKR
jgi:hypothetical protein